MGKVAKDKWDKVIEYLTHSNRDPEKVLNLLKGSDQGKESNYDINRSSYSLNIIAIITQKQLDPQNKGKSLTHIIRHWVKSKDFIQFYNLMRSEEKLTWDKAKVEVYTKQLQDLWYSKAQSKNKEYFKRTDGYYMMGMGFQKTTGLSWDKARNRKLVGSKLHDTSRLPKAKVIETVFNKIKKSERTNKKNSVKE
tara:strand:- start:135 stop:716 length:582 start_codon:yes stop_codon:yes gene_type:complete